MVQVSTEKDTYLADFEWFERDGVRSDPVWVQRIRRAAISRFAELGFPTTEDEEWRFTSVDPIVKVRFKPADVRGYRLTAERPERLPFGGWASAQLVFVNGHYSPELSSLRSLPEGVRGGSLQEVLKANPVWVEPYLARYAGYQDHAFVALNTAFMEDGAFIYVPKGTVVGEPIHLLFVSTPDQEPFVVHPRNLIIVGESGRVAIVESYLGLQQHVYFTNAVTEIVVGENGVIEHYKLELESEEAFHIATLQGHLDRSSHFTSYSISMGGALVRNDLNVVLDGEGGECTLNGLYVVTGRQHVDNHTRIDHVKPYCLSREFYKGILDGQSRAVFNGKISVHKLARRTDAHQLNKNLLLSEDAVIDTKPHLEIYNNDVKCSHGSTIGQLDQGSLFYLRSRGMDLQAARTLLTYAFASEISGRIKIEPIRTRLEHLLVAKLHQGQDVRGML